MGLFPGVPLKLHKLLRQDPGAFFVRPQAVRTHIGGLDDIVVQGRRALHQRTAHQGRSRLVGRHRQLPGGRLGIKLAVRVNKEAGNSPLQHRFSTAEPCQDLIISTVDSVFPQRYCKKQPPPLEPLRTIFVVTVLPQLLHGIHHLGRDPLQSRPEDLVQTALLRSFLWIDHKKLLFLLPIFQSIRLLYDLFQIFRRCPDPGMKGVRQGKDLGFQPVLCKPVLHSHVDPA